MLTSVISRASKRFTSSCSSKSIRDSRSSLQTSSKSANSLTSTSHSEYGLVRGSVFRSSRFFCSQASKPLPWAKEGVESSNTGVKSAKFVAPSQVDLALRKMLKNGDAVGAKRFLESIPTEDWTADTIDVALQIQRDKKFFASDASDLVRYALGQLDKIPPHTLKYVSVNLMRLCSQTSSSSLIKEKTCIELHRRIRSLPDFAPLPGYYINYASALLKCAENRQEAQQFALELNSLINEHPELAIHHPRFTEVIVQSVTLFRGVATQDMYLSGELQKLELHRGSDLRGVMNIIWTTFQKTQASMTPELALSFCKAFAAGAIDETTLEGVHQALLASHHTLDRVCIAYLIAGFYQCGKYADALEWFEVFKQTPDPEKSPELPHWQRFAYCAVMCIYAKDPEKLDLAKSALKEAYKHETGTQAVTFTTLLTGSQPLIAHLVTMMTDTAPAAMRRMNDSLVTYHLLPELVKQGKFDLALPISDGLGYVSPTQYSDIRGIKSCISWLKSIRWPADFRLTKRTQVLASLKTQLSALPDFLDQELIDTHLRLLHSVGNNTKQMIDEIHHLRLIPSSKQNSQETPLVSDK